MSNLKLTINLLPKGAWGNDFSQTMPKKDWDTLREYAYKKANHTCEICGKKTDKLNAHEEWEFDIPTKTQTLKNIIALCHACHGVKHMKNSIRIGYEESSKAHFIKVNNCSPMDFAKHYTDALVLFEERNEVFRWRIKADLSKFGGKGIEFNERYIPFVDNPYEGIVWNDVKLNYSNYFSTKTMPVKEINTNTCPLAPKVRQIEVNNYNGIITVACDYTNNIQWFNENNDKLKTKYNTAGKFVTEFCVEDLTDSSLFFKLNGNCCETVSQAFKLVKI